MEKSNLEYLGRCVFAARQDCGLTQKELAQQTQLTVKTIQNIEKGRKNPTYNTLVKLISRLGMTADVLFQTETSVEKEKFQYFMGKFQACDQNSQKILLDTLNFLAEQLMQSLKESEKTV